jgi:serine/threonine protein kinase
MVMDFENGQPLAAILEKHETISEDEIKSILNALLDGLERVHGASVWHRDIKPSNILIRPDGSPVLIDFGAARKNITGTDRSTMAIFSPAYAAPEQISPVGDQGPWTDIYALGATLYRVATGDVPKNAAKRLQDDAYVPAIQAAGENYSPAFLAAIDAALQLYPKDRPQSISEWRDRFAVSVAKGEDKTRLRPLPTTVPKRKKRRYRGLIAMIAVIAVVAVGWWIYRLSNGPTIVEQADTVIDKKIQTEPPDVQTEQAEAVISEPVGDDQLMAEEAALLIQAKLKIDSVPNDAQVFLDDEFKGTTPLDAVVTDGTHSLRLSLEDHYDWESSILIEEEDEIPIRIPLLRK